MNGLHASDGVKLIFASLCITLSPHNQTTFQHELAKVELEKKAFEQLIEETRRLTLRVELLSHKCQDKRLQNYLISV